MLRNKLSELRQKILDENQIVFIVDQYLFSQIKKSKANTYDRFVIDLEHLQAEHANWDWIDSKIYQKQTNIDSQTSKKLFYNS